MSIFLEPKSYKYQYKIFINVGEPNFMATGNTIKLYKFPLVIGLTQTDHGVSNNNMPFGDSDFKVYRGSHNPIEFVVRNNDRKPIPLVGKCITMTVINFFTEAIVTQIKAQVIDGPRGRVRVTFTPQMTAAWDTGFYKYTMLIENDDNTVNLLHIDKDQNAAGSFEFIDNVLPQLVDSQVILGSQFTPTNNTPPTVDPTIWVSGAFPADSTFCERDGLHTVAAYVTNFAGKFYVEGSLELSPKSNNKDWFVIKLTEFFPYHEFGNVPDPDCTFTGIEAFNFEAMLRFVRFKFIPDSDNPGTFDQVLFRN